MPQFQGPIETITALLDAIDRRDWDTVNACLDEEVVTDYVSLFGGTPQKQRGADLIASWRRFLPGFDSTQHMTGPVLVDVKGGSGTATCAVTAEHWLGDAVWRVSGQYRADLILRAGGWTISGLALKNARVQGDMGLPARASARASSKLGGKPSG
jgi:ketosteroid isomerase-like protein